MLGSTEYLCHNAVCLTSAEPTGPWQYADDIPSDFAEIPPSSPAYNTTFVKVRRSDDEVVEYEYTSGYEGAYVEDDELKIYAYKISRTINGDEYFVLAIFAAPD